jgi:hypothetical protein
VDAESDGVELGDHPEVDAAWATKKRNDKIVFHAIIGLIAGCYGFFQLLQLLGILGVGFSFFGLGITAGAFAISAVCLIYVYQLINRTIS